MGCELTERVQCGVTVLPQVARLPTCAHAGALTRFGWPLFAALLKAEEAKRAAEEAEKRRKEAEMEAMRREAAEVRGGRVCRTGVRLCVCRVRCLLACSAQLQACLLRGVSTTAGLPTACRLDSSRCVLCMPTLPGRGTAAAGGG